MADELGRIVERLSPKLGEPEGESRPLEGGITNRNYLVTLGGNRYVIRVPGKDTSLLGIDRSAEREANENAAAIGVAPRVVAQLDDPPCLVTEFVECTEMTPEGLRDPETTKRVLETIRSVHESGADLPTNFDSFRVVEEYRETAASRGGEIPAAYDEAHQRARQIEAALSGPEHEPVPCHNDLLAGNFLRGSERIWIVDWEYAGMGDRYFDLANFAINNEFSTPSTPSCSPTTSRRSRVRGGWRRCGSCSSCRISARRCGGWSRPSPPISTSISRTTPPPTSSGCERPRRTRASTGGSRRPGLADGPEG